jgi:hypothetical protein
MDSPAPNGPSESRASSARIDAGSAERVRGIRLVRFVMVGSTSVAAVVLVVVAFAILGKLTSPSPPLLIGAGYLGFLGVFGWFALRTASRRICDWVAIDDRGVHAKLQSGRELNLDWADPKFSLRVTYFVVQPRTTPRITLVWGYPKQETSATLTTSGAEALRSEARRRGISESQKTQGRPPRTWNVYDLKAALPGVSAPAATPATTAHAAPPLPPGPPAPAAAMPPPPPPSVTPANPVPQGAPQLRRCTRCRSLATIRMHFCPNCGAPLG